MTEETDLDPQGARLQRAGKRYAEVVGGDWCEFERGVKLITGGKRLDRAMPWFRKFLRSHMGTEKEGDEMMARYRASGITTVWVGLLREAFKKWKRLEKSRAASQSGKKGAQGRVRSRNDKRLGARPPG
jgi:hypothetical protein